MIYTDNGFVKIPSKRLDDTSFRDEELWESEQVPEGNRGYEFILRHLAHVWYGITQLNNNFFVNPTMDNPCVANQKKILMVLNIHSTDEVIIKSA